MLTVTVKMSSRYMASGSPVFSPNAKAGDGVVGRQHHVDRVPGFVEVALDESADLLGLEVVRIVIAGGEDIGADQNAAADFLSEAGCAGFGIHVDDVLAGYA